MQIPRTVGTEVMLSILHVDGYGIDPAAARLDRLCDSLDGFEHALTVELGHAEGQKERGLAIAARSLRTRSPSSAPSSTQCHPRAAQANF